MVAAARARWDGLPLVVGHGACEFVVITGENAEEKSEGDSEVDFGDLFFRSSRCKGPLCRAQAGAAAGRPLVGWMDYKMRLCVLNAIT